MENLEKFITHILDFSFFNLSSGALDVRVEFVERIMIHMENCEPVPVNLQVRDREEKLQL